MKQHILDYIVKHSFYTSIIRFLKKVKVEEGRISLYEIARVFMTKLWNDEILERANGVAFSFTLAIFPAVIFLFTLIPYIDPIPDLDTKAMEFLQEWMPAYMYDTVASTIQDILSRPRGGLLSFGFLFSVFLATNGMLTLMKAFNSVYKTVENRGFFKTRFIATLLTFMLAFVFLLALVLLIVVPAIIKVVMESEFFKEVGIPIDGFTIFLIQISRFIVMFSVFMIAISFIYYFGPAIEYKWRFFSTGSLIATVLTLAVSYGFSFYISNFGTYNKFYGSIGALIALMIWFFLLAVIMLVGYELNASIHKATKHIREEKIALKELA